jgi:acyl dehydratase
VQYAGASGDFNPMHHDEVKAQAAGLPSVFGHGMFSMGFLAAAINDYVGVGNLKQYKVRFAKQTWPDDVLITSVTVKAKRNEGGENLVDLECVLTTDKGVVVVQGDAVAALPSRVA